jgi:hypothetical protein
MRHVKGSWRNPLLQVVLLMHLRLRPLNYTLVGGVPLRPNNVRSYRALVPRVAPLRRSPACSLHLIR